MYWNYKDLIDWINNGCDKEIANNIIKLDISHNSTIIEIPKEIEHLVNLKILSIEHCNIKEIPKEIKNLTKLYYFNCCSNQITSIPVEIGYLINLTTFLCADNKINELPNEIGNFVELINFECYKNHIKKIPNEIGNLINLIDFSCHTNEISEIPTEIKNLTNLKIFCISSNRITQLPQEILNLHNLKFFNCSHNPIEYIPPNVIRFINRHKLMLNKNNSIYNDSQNIHNHHIQESIKKSIQYILQIKPMINTEQLNQLILQNEFLSNKSKQLIYEYKENKEIHSILNITFEELLLNTISMIESNNNKTEIYKILSEEMESAECKCFTGRINRLVSSLAGFYEEIQIQISENEQISNIINQIKKKLEQQGIYNIQTHKSLAFSQLIEMYDKSIIEEWLNYIE